MIEGFDFDFSNGKRPYIVQYLGLPVIKFRFPWRCVIQCEVELLFQVSGLPPQDHREGNEGEFVGRTVEVWFYSISNVHITLKFEKFCLPYSFISQTLRWIDIGSPHRLHTHRLTMR